MSKGLEALKQVALLETGGGPEFPVEYILPEQIETIEKELKALDIIVTKKVNLYGDDLYTNGVYGLNYYSTYEHYKASCEKLRYKKKSILTEEEFNLLKEVLK
jgi:hypothetical protein